MFSNPLTRFLIGVPLALVMTLALFHLMRFFISADFEEPENLREYNLESITPEAQEEQVMRKRCGGVEVSRPSPQESIPGWWDGEGGARCRVETEFEELTQPVAGKGPQVT